MLTELLLANDYSISLVVFFITYVLFEVPSNLILAKTRPSIFLATIMTLWGVVTCCMVSLRAAEMPSSVG